MYGTGAIGGKETQHLRKVTWRDPLRGIGIRHGLAVGWRINNAGQYRVNVNAIGLEFF